VLADAHRLGRRERPLGEHDVDGAAQRGQDLGPALDLVLAREDLVEDVLQRLLDLGRGAQRGRGAQQRAVLGEVDEARERVGAVALGWPVAAPPKQPRKPVDKVVAWFEE